jgi:hypothetical protein
MRRQLTRALRRAATAAPTAAPLAPPLPPLLARGLMTAPRRGPAALARWGAPGAASASLAPPAAQQQRRGMFIQTQPTPNPQRCAPATV